MHTFPLIHSITTARKVTTAAASTLASTLTSSSLMSSSGTTTFDSSPRSASISSLLTSTATSSSSPGTSPKAEGKATWRFARLAKIASLGSLFSNFSSGSNSSSSHNGGGQASSSNSSESQRKQNRGPISCGRLAKGFSSSSSSLANSSALVAGNNSEVPSPNRQALYYNPSLFYFAAYPRQQQCHPHHRLSYQYQTASSLASMSLPVISPLIEVKRGSYPRDEYSNGPVELHHLPPIYVTQASQQGKQQTLSPPSRKPSASLRWLRGNSLRGKGKKEPIELPPTVLYPERDEFQNHHQQPIIKKSGIRTGSLEGGNEASTSATTTPAHIPLRPSLTLSHLDSLTANLSEHHNKRSSVYSQLSFDSIDSRLSLVDDSAFEESLDCAGSGVNGGSICLSPSGNRRNRNWRPPPLPLPAPITLPQSPDTPNSFQFDGTGNSSSQQQRQQMYGRLAEKAKSDTHLYFTLDETSTEEALRENYDSKLQFFFGDDDLVLPEEDTVVNAGEETPPATPLKRNSNRRTSLYAKFISAKRATTKAASSPSSTVNSVKQRFRFRSSSKVPARLAGSGGRKNSGEVPPLPPSKRSSVLSNEEPLSLHREPQYPPVPAPRMSTATARLGSLVSASSVNLSSASSSDRRDSASVVGLHGSQQQHHQHQPTILAAGFRRRSYKSATEMNSSFMQRAQSSILPLATNSANSTSSHLDQYTRSSLNTIKSDDHGHSSEGYGTDRGVTPDVPSSASTLPPTRPESRSSQPRERSLIRTIRKRLSFTKRSKSVERSVPASSSFRESSMGASSSGLNGAGSAGQIDRDERARSVPGSREPSAPRDNLANGKKQESFLSLASNTSFFAENSTLVLECSVNGEKKHYIVPYSKANKRKYRRRKGTKLHVFNDHLFVAQHVSSSQECQVCAKTFPMRIGKQGYVCRECGFLTHKLCHVNVESYCPANGAARLNFEVDGSGDAIAGNGNGGDTPRQMPSPVPEVRVIAPTEPFNEKEVF